MNILHINTSADEGGAASAVRRLHQGLIQAGYNSRILARSAKIKDDNIFLISDVLEGTLGITGRLSEQAYKRIEKYLGFLYWFFPSTLNLVKTDLFQWADIVNFHNLHGSYFNPRAIPVLTKSKPVVWTIHDMWPFTGHCGYTYNCEKWVEGCCRCPVFQDADMKKEYPRATPLDMTKIIWRLKQDIYKKSNLYIITPSRWMRSMVEKSILGRSVFIECIPNGIDTEKFYPMDKLQARRELGIGGYENVLIFVAHDVKQIRKGYAYLLSALEKLQDEFNICLLLLGEIVFLDARIQNVFIKRLGYVNSDDLLRLCYNAADLIVLPALADNQPLVLMEAMACGTPAVTFDTGGIPEMVRHMDNGYVARYKDSDDLASGIRLLFRNRNLLSEMSRKCRKIVEDEYSLQLQVKRYRHFYEMAVCEWKKINSTK